MRTLKQHLKSDCAAACLAYVARHHRLEISVAMARRLAGTSPSGTTALGLVQAAERLGLMAKGIRAGPGAPASCPKPAIAHVKLTPERNHYVVLIGEKAGRLHVFDPATGRKSWSAAEVFAAIWTGVLIILAPGKAFEPGDRTTGR